ncbi:hypothetical protein ACWEN6_13475 [Sphaerisporangium sp. NPDC004334]
MAELLAVVFAQLQRVDGVLIWHFHVADEAGALRLFIVPHESFANQVARYALDPDDVDTVIDYVLHERLIRPDPTAGVEVVASSGTATAQSSARAVAAPTTPEAARQAHLQQLAEVKTRARFVTPAEQVRTVAERAGGKASRAAVAADPLDLVRQHLVLDPDDIAARREWIWGRRRAADTIRGQR